MKKTLYHNKSLWILTFFAPLLFISCLKDKEIEEIDIDFPEPVELKAVQLIGQVLDSDDNPAVGAEVEIASHFLPFSLKRITNQEGYYFFPEFTNRGEEVLVMVNHADHFEGLYSQRILDDQNPVILSSQLTKTKHISSFLPENGAQVSVDNNLQIEIAPNSFESHVGEIQLSAKLISNQDPANYLREINGRGFISSNFQSVNVNPQFTLLIEFTDEFGGNPVLLKEAQFTLNLNNVDWLENYKSVDAYHLQFSGFNYWLEGGSIEIAGNVINGSFDKSGIWTIGGRVDKQLTVKGKLTTDESLLALESKVKMMTEDGSIVRLIRTGVNGAFQFDDVLPAKSFYLKFFNSCEEEIHSYGPLSVFESTDLGEITIPDFPLAELWIDARDCNDNVGNTAFVRVAKSGGTSYFRPIDDHLTDLAIPLCGNSRVEVSLLDVSGNQIKSPLEIDLTEGRQYISDPYNCFDPDLTVEADIILLSSATGDTVYNYQYSMYNPKHRLVLEVNTTANDLVESYRIKGKNDCLDFNIHLVIESGKISNVLLQELEFFCFEFKYEYQDSMVGHTGYPSSYDGGEFINQVNIIDLKNLDNGQLYDILIEFRSSN